VRARRFDPDDDLIMVKAKVFGTHGNRVLSLALDTAASHTHVSPDIIDEPGASPRRTDCARRRAPDPPSNVGAQRLDRASWTINASRNGETRLSRRRVSS
jgi:hypothetical protein